MKPEFYNVLVYMYRLNKIMDRTDFSDQFQKITICDCHKFDIDHCRETNSWQFGLNQNSENI